MNRLFLFSAFFLLAVQTSFADGIDFFHGTWPEALEAAKEEGKPIFVDAYAVWCGPCKRMAKEVFTRKDVGDFYNANFINLKMDMEAEANLVFRQAYPVSAFPTLFYIDSQGEVIRKVKGAQKAEAFIQLGKSILSKVDFSADYAKEYEKGNRDPEFIYKYLQSLNKSKKSTIKVANLYLKAQEDLSTPINQKIIFEAATEADSKLFDQLIANRKSIEKLVGKEAVAERIEQACATTVQKAIEYEFPELMEEANAKMKAHLPKKSERFALLSQLDFCIAVGDAKKYAKCCSNYAKKEAKNDDQELHKLAQQMKDNFRDDPTVMKQAEKYAKKALDQNADVLAYRMTYATILNYNGKKSEALKIVNSSREMAQQQGAVRELEMLIRRIEG
ncbi:MAG: thioredoxin family protein [Bacteroidota bacterium]